MNIYQLVFITAQDTEEAQKKITECVTTEKGEVIHTEKWGKKDFAYPIKKNPSGYYFEWHITMDKGKIPVFKKKMDSDENVLRYLLIKSNIKK